MVDILWVVLAERETTNATFSLMWQLCPQGPALARITMIGTKGFSSTKARLLTSRVAGN